jgi:hypothetical protein
MSNVLHALGVFVLVVLVYGFFRSFWRPAPRGERARRTAGDWSAASFGWTRESGQGHSGNDTGPSQGT